MARIVKGAELRHAKSAEVTISWPGRQCDRRL